MTFSSYPEYKSSGHEWVGEIPSHWLIYRSKNIFSERNVKALESDEQLTASQKYGVIPQKLFSALEDQKVMQVILGRDILKKAEINDFVISMRSFQGGLEFCPYSGAVSSAYVPLFANREIDNRFFKHLFKSIPFISALQNTSNLVRDGQALRYNNFVQLSLPFPSLNEQRTIGAFLDHETARIDALIEEQQRLIELLKEKRQAVISHAVTKGLDSTVPMKDSGVEWLGEVPCSWRVIKFGITHDKAELGGNYEAGESEEGLPLIKMGNIGRGKIKLDKVEYVSLTQDIDNGHTLKEGDFLFNTRNSLDLVGKVCVWRRELQAALYNSNILRISFNKSLIGSSGFVNYLLNSNLGLEQLRLIARGTTSVAAIYYKDLSSLSFAFPLPSEQLEIERFLDIQTSQLDALVNAAEQAIDLIKERRSALISAAVTGKIDVRGWQPPASASTPELVQEAV
ncbi:restriction endonuclease subunit S [Stutzerimonas kunmingensis]|uniref:restriction endonuclease subunit S n=1 Tax=Stutzerimonas kunmingensis TaxID=1211807 RepID=UPI00242037AF|nr:restriction endonuclease subunit S [Stutzerimonas kunmingensis]